MRGCSLSCLSSGAQDELLAIGHMDKTQADAGSFSEFLGIEFEKLDNGSVNMTQKGFHQQDHRNCWND
jgi:hypothetical protein